MDGLENEILEYIKVILKENDPTLLLDDIEAYTDLSEYGVESIMVLTIISEIEGKFKKRVSLSSLEENKYIISADTLARSLKN